jgi:hypothetical protein
MADIVLIGIPIVHRDLWKMENVEEEHKLGCNLLRCTFMASICCTIASLVHHLFLLKGFHSQQFLIMVTAYLEVQFNQGHRHTAEYCRHLHAFLCVIAKL